MLTGEIRRRFLQFYMNNGHTQLPSAPLPNDDPQQLFVIAGMVPMVPYLLMQQTPPASRVTSIQKCVRTLDIDEVGTTTRHNTFFEMAGNFSFGDYFKKEAIEYAWTLLTNSISDGGFGVPAEKLWSTVYYDDDESVRIWEKHIGQSPQRIQHRGKKDNYWSMGIPGPAGTCSELFYDRGSQYGPEGGPEVNEDRYIEIWNLVFMDKLRGEGIGKEDFEILGDLPRKNIDTGMGVDRLAFLLQGVENIYESDTLRPVIDTVAQITDHTYGKDTTYDRHFRVIADHTRTAVMLINDGISPGNEGRGYILRRILRRIVRSARLLDAITDTGVGMGEFITASITTMESSYPDLIAAKRRILDTAIYEEQAFLHTLSSGSQLFLRTANATKKRGASLISGNDVFVLHDTYGFPVDLTVEMAAEAGLNVDREGFFTLMQEQKERAKLDAYAKKRGHTDQSVYREFIDRGPTNFIGYDQLNSIATVIGLIHNGQRIPVASAGYDVELIVDRTPLYAEGGGQLADRGTVITDDGTRIEIYDVRKIAKTLWSHYARIATGQLYEGQEVNLHVDPMWRHQAEQAHSATHIIHGALREILGSHATQAGSLNKPGYLRFDFRWNDKIDQSRYEKIESLTNEIVDGRYPVNTFVTGLEDAKRLGALALFGEQYDDEVRVVEIAGHFSRELCGGTHVSNSAYIGPVAIIGESSVGSGVRRIEAFVGTEGFGYLARERALLGTVSSLLKVPSSEIPDKVVQLVDRVKEAEKKISQLTMSIARKQLDEALRSARSEPGIGFGVAFLTQELPKNTSNEDLRRLLLHALEYFGDMPAVIALAVNISQRVSLIVGTTSSARERGLDALVLLKAALEHIAGKGGGKSDIAQGSGIRYQGLQQAFAAIKNAVFVHRTLDNE